MHHCLAIYEILSNILEKLFQEHRKIGIGITPQDALEASYFDDLIAEQTLAALALTCRGFLGDHNTL